MNRAFPSLPSAWLAPIGAAAAPLAAFLAFSVQLLLAKHLLPIYGGTSSVWLGSNLYFQTTLVLGYAWAVFLLRRPPRQQAGATIGLALLALLTFHLPANTAAEPTIALVVGRLALGSLPAMVLLFSVSPLLHGWVRGEDGRPPYHLYALSNAGSLLGLAAYPFLIEPFFGLKIQVGVWEGLQALLAVLLALAATAIWRQPAGRPADVAAPASPFPWNRAPLWFALGALGVVNLLGATHHVSAEIGSHPLAWVGPLGLYLLGFTFAFSSRWRPWMTQTCIALLGLSLAGFMVVKGFTSATVRGPNLIWLGLLSASGGFLGAALLHHSRPDDRPEWFYLLLGAGGAAGGLAAAHVVPFVFPAPVELCLTSVLLLFAGVLWLVGCRAFTAGLVLLVVLASPVLILGLDQLGRRAEGIQRVQHLRDEVGNLMLEFGQESIVLSSDATTHGSQLTATPESRRRPTLYYTESTGVGRAIARLQASRPAIRLGVVGLGAGTLAAYTRPGDSCDFWDIDEKVIRIAREQFTFLADAAGTVNVIRVDGRKALEASTDDYDLIVIDAFTGDGVPPHLLTREAIAGYMARLKARDGLLVVHGSSRSSDYYPVLGTTARSMGLAAIGVGTTIREAAAAEDWDPTPSDYILLCQPGRFFDVVAWFPEEEQEGRVTRNIRIDQAPGIDPRQVWTDDRNAALDVLDLGRYLFDK